MGIVVSLVGFMPPPRYDLVPWTIIDIQEAPAPTGPWTMIDTQVLPAPDPDPTQPASRNITTSFATLTSGWYQVVFVDAFGGTSVASDPIRNDVDDGTLPPSPDAIRNMSPLLRQNFPEPPTDLYSVSDLRNTVYQSIALVQSLTWRFIDPTLPCGAPDEGGYTCEPVPANLVPVAFQAVARMSERINVTTEPDFAEQLASGRLLRGFTAGPYSENYFSPGEFSRRGVSARPTMDIDDALDQALWALATEDARDYFVWRSTGIAPPIGLASAFDYRQVNGGYSAGSLGGPFGYGGVGGGIGPPGGPAGGPDGF